MLYSKESHGCRLDKKNGMKESKRKKLEAAGWEVGSSEEFLKNQLFIDHEIELGWKPMCLRNRMSYNNSI